MEGDSLGYPESESNLLLDKRAGFFSCFQNNIIYNFNGEQHNS